MEAQGAENPAETAVGEERLDERYGIEFRPDSVARLCHEHGLTYPGVAAAAR